MTCTIMQSRSKLFLLGSYAEFFDGAIAINIDDLEWTWTVKIGGFSFFLQFSASAHILWIELRRKLQRQKRLCVLTILTLPLNYYKMATFQPIFFWTKIVPFIPAVSKSGGGICRPTPTSYSGAAQHSWYKTVQQTEFPSAKTECEFCMQRASTQG